MDVYKEFDEAVISLKRDLIKQLLTKCNADQVAFFNRMYNSVDEMKEDQMPHAYRQCKTTVERNEAKEGKQ